MHSNLALAPGTRVGVYEVIAPIGEGGMGQVYRATDTTLGRQVAIKILPEAFASDPDRMARFEREAKTLGALNHPHIAAIYGFEKSPGMHALVMELIEGEDLSQRIARGAIPLDEALPIAKQIADALEAAHEQNIIHRDLKPANIKVRADGTVKVLDFGLAKALAPEGGGAAADAMNSPTLTRQGYGAAGTQLGMIIGTAAYMAPEQAKGRAVDRRADIWAFGVVLYEMLTGRRAFEGDDVSEILASVLKTAPDLGVVPAGVSPSVRRLLRRCLEKDPRKRLSAIGDARLELDEIDPAAPAVRAPAPPARRSIVALLWPAAVGIVATAAVAALLWPSSRSAPDTTVTRLSVVTPQGVDIYPDSAEVAISPDGRMVAFVVGNSGSITTSQLWIRSLDAIAPRRLEGGDGAHLPFWSPDSRSIGFGADGKLKTLPVAGGRAEEICAAANFRGGAWNTNAVIVFAPEASGPLHRVPAGGGEPTPVTALDAARKQTAHRFPIFLPDGDHFLFAALPGGRDGAFDIFAGSLAANATTLVSSMHSAPVYAPSAGSRRGEPGWLLFSRRGVLTAQPFDADTLKMTGEAVSLADEPTAQFDTTTQWTAGRGTSVSSTGALAYFSALSVLTKAVWLDAAGKPGGAVDLPPGRYADIRVSPDATRAVFVRHSSQTESRLWLADLQRGQTSPLTAGRGLNASPVWSPDSTRVVFSSNRDGPEDLFVKDVTDASPERPLYRSSVLFKYPNAWSPDGKWIAFYQVDPVTLENIYLLPASGEIAPKVYVAGSGSEIYGSVSADGKWLAYVSDDSGTPELYAQSFPAPGRRVRISTGGAGWSWWARDGRHIVYLDPRKTSLMIADVEPGETLKVGTPRVMASLPPGVIAIDAMPDRQKWLALVPENAGAGTVTVVQNWMAGLKK
jgi:eukaryotic-like serine/threonine-protein kinase